LYAKADRDLWGDTIFEPAPYGVYCPTCPGKPHERQDKFTVAHLEKLSGAARGAPAAEFDTAYRCHACGTIYSFQYGVSFALFEVPRTRSLWQSWQLFLGHARSSVYGRLLSARVTPRRSRGARWHNLVARDQAVEQRHDRLLATIAETVPDMVRPLESAAHEPVCAPLIVKSLDAGVAEPVNH
jgi:rubredoxin